MNEQIYKIARQADALARERVPDLREIVLYDRIRDEKFAELLVLECVNAVMDGTKEGDHYAMRIEKHFDNGPGGILHFGVEE